MEILPSPGLRTCFASVRECVRVYGQANKRTWWMPRQLEAMKDVVACDKPRGGG